MNTDNSVTNEITPTPGIRVKMCEPLNFLPDFRLEEIGRTGTVSEVTADLFAITLDEPIPGWGDTVTFTTDSEMTEDKSAFLTLPQLFAMYFDVIDFDPL